MKTQVNSLKISSFPNILSLKLFGNPWGKLYDQFLVIISCFTFPLFYGYGFSRIHCAPENLQFKLLLSDTVSFSILRQGCSLLPPPSPRLCFLPSLIQPYSLLDTAPWNSHIQKKIVPGCIGVEIFSTNIKK